MGLLNSPVEMMCLFTSPESRGMGLNLFEQAMKSSLKLRAVRKALRQPMWLKQNNFSPERAPQPALWAGSLPTGRQEGAQDKMKLPCREAPPCLSRPNGMGGKLPRMSESLRVLLPGFRYIFCP